MKIDANGNDNSKLSVRSNIPPIPENIFPESFPFAECFNIDSTKSPTSDNRAKSTDSIAALQK